MRLAAYAQIRNEADIVRVFARHLAALYDYVLVVDHGSVDGTSAVLADACETYAGWTCWRCDIAGHHQAALAKFAIDHLFATTDADVVVVHDADEFLAVPERSDLEQRLGVLDQPRTVGELRWLNCVPVHFGSREIFDPSSGFWRPAPGPGFSKMVISRRLMAATGGRARPSMGNHSVDPNDGGVVEVKHIGELLHFPVRSALQISRKAVIGMVSNALRADRLAHENVHWQSIVRRIAEGPLDDAELTGLAVRYGDGDAARTRIATASLPQMGFTLQRADIALARDFETTSSGMQPDPWQIMAAALREPLPVRGDALDLYVENDRLLARQAIPAS